MRCPNPECPYARKHHRPAEYRAGMTTCSDCRAALVDGPVDVPSTSTGFGTARAPALPALPWPRHVVTALMVTVVAAGSALALGFVPLPYVDREALMGILGPGVSAWSSAWALTSVSAGALGVTPWLTAAFVVEVVAVLVPALRRKRHAGVEARAPLERAALVVGALFAVAQAWMLTDWLASLQGMFADSVAPELWNIGPKLVVIGTIVGGACLTRLAALVIDKSGVGNGLMMIVFSTLVIEAVRALQPYPSMLQQDIITPFQFLVGLAALFAAPAFVAWRTVQVRVTPSSASFVVRPSAGIVPATMVFALPALAATIATFVQAVPLAATTTTLAGAIVAAALVPLCASVWSSPARIALLRARIDGRVSASADELAQAYVEAADARVPTWLLNGMIVVALAVSTLWLPHGFQQVVAIVVLVGSVRDLETELRARRAASGPLVSVGAVHRLDLVNPLLALLAREQIDATLRGAHVRALSHFFAPWLPVEIFVDEADAARARSIVRDAIARCVEANPSQVPDEIRA